MDELLEYGRGEFEPSTWFMDEETSQTINVSAEVVKSAFERFTVSWPRCSRCKRKDVFAFQQIYL